MTFWDRDIGRSGETMKNFLAIVALSVVILSLLFFYGIHIWNATLDKQINTEIINGMDLDVDEDEINIEKTSDTHGGFHGDGDSIFEITFKGEAVPELSGWKDLPIDEDISFAYGLEKHKEGKSIFNIQKGRWKLVGKNYYRDMEMYGNIILYIYDEEGKCIYAYKLDT